MLVNILESDVNCAIEEIKVFLKTMSEDCIKKGWTFFIEPNAPESFTELKKFGKSKNLPIANSGSDTSIYGLEYNTLFRFYHDVTHLELNQSFSEVGENAVNKKHIQDMIKYNKLSSLAIKIFNIDTSGQVQYYFHHKSFVNNQRTFLDTCLRHGIKDTIRFLKP
jgi:hypothetical protein